MLREIFQQSIMDTHHLREVRLLLNVFVEILKKQQFTKIPYKNDQLSMFMVDKDTQKLISNLTGISQKIDNNLYDGLKHFSQQELLWIHDLCDLCLGIVTNSVRENDETEFLDVMEYLVIIDAIEIIRNEIFSQNRSYNFTKA